MLYSPDFMGSGTYTDTLTVEVCTDSMCQSQIQGSPVKVSVTYIVTGNVVSNASYELLPTSIDLEAPSNAAAPTTTVNVTAESVPPYGAYVFETSQSGGPVQSMSFKQTSSVPLPYSYATGVLTVNMKTPASLGPGLYTDQITLSICYDSACTKPAMGSPFTIPVTYLITASAGREFQEQVIEQNLSVLAVDPTGSTLYGVTQLTSSSNPQLLEINPESGTVTTLMGLDYNVQQLLVSADGQYLYMVGQPPQTAADFPQWYALRVPIASMTIDQTVPLGPAFGTYRDISIDPQSSSTWAAAFDSVSNVWSVEIFDGSVARPDIWSVPTDAIYSNQAVWSADGQTLYVLDTNLNAVAVTPTGLGSGTLLQSGSAAQSPGFDFGGNLQLAAGLLYSDGGEVLDPATNTIVGTYTFGSVPYAAFTIDPPNNRVFASYLDTASGEAQGTLRSFNLSQFTPIWIARLPVGSTPVRWGSDGLAWIASSPTVTGADALYLISGTFVAPSTQ